MTRQLIVTADDFGMSLEVNEAVEQAHRDGILTCASLVVAGDAADDAIRRAKRLPGLGVGLHLAVYGAPATCREPSPLARDGRNLGETEALTGAAIMLTPRAQAAARREIAAQFDAYRRSGLPLGHLDGHRHCQLQPAVLRLAIEHGRPLGLKWVRVPYERFDLARGVARAGRLASAAHVIGNRPLAAAMRRQLHRAAMGANDHFFGRASAGSVDEAVLLRLIERLPSGVTELGLHPATTNWSGPHAPPSDWHQAGELAALTSPRVRGAVEASEVALVRWADLR